MTLPDLRPASGPLGASPAGLLAVAVEAGPAGPVPGPDALALAAELGVDLGAHLSAEKAKGEPGEVHALPVFGRRADTTTVFLVGVGKPDAPAHALRRAGAALARRAAKAGGELATSVPAGLDAEHLGAFAEGLLLASYTFSTTAPKKDATPLTAVHLHGVGKGKSSGAALDRARTHVTAVVLARDLANEPSLDKTPAWLAKQAQAAAKRSGLACEVVEPAELERRGFGGILGVGSGAGPARGPRFIRLDHTPSGRAAKRPHVVLVGKGITFDTGGLSLKPNEGMAAMKTDMSGGAAVIAVLQAAASTGLPVRLTGLVAAAENMPSGTAMRPGDVLRHYGGRTVEVLNTDAEGRLVLADALAYAAKEIKPDYVVDIATLTGAIGIALGKRTGGLFASDDALADALLAAADRAGEPLWRMPLVEDYRADLDSPIADLKNIGGRFSGGAITAALFLREFAGDVAWAHLDIASAARSDSDDDERTKGATGYVVRTLLCWLETLAAR
ncbi:MAG TPA: leucyl aminopeptidase [Frankiaceae bacterium]|nr:leucyl aminopeptidase [Frankiaceae bacterium]